MSSTKKFSTGKKITLIIIISVIVIVILASFIVKFFSSGGMSGDTPFDEELLKAKGMIAVEATVTSDLSEYFDEHIDNYDEYIVSYYVNDQLYSSTLKGDQIGISVGDKFTAYYNPNNPLEIIRPVQPGTAILFIAIISFAIIIFILPPIVIISLIVFIIKKSSKQKMEVVNREKYNNPYNYNNINNNSNNPTYNNPYSYNNINNNSNSPTYYNPYDYNNNDNTNNF